MSEIPSEKYLIYLGNWGGDETDETTKIGKTTNLYNRCCNYNTSHPFLDFTPYVIIEVYNEYELNNAEVYLHYVYEKYSACHSLTKYNKRNEYNEWFTTRPSQAEVEKHLQKFGIDYRAYSDEEVEEEMRLIHEKEREYNEKKEKERNKIRERIKELENKRNGVVEYEWNERQYQTNIIHYSIQQLATNGRLYIELPTGAGKSYIFYKIANHTSPKIIVAFSSRININKQNVQEKYLSILQNKYAIYDCSTRNDYESFSQKHEYHIIVACTNSHEKVYDMIKEAELNDIIIWFDEAHHGVEKWIENQMESISFLLKDKRIPNRVFTSASPDKKVIDLNPDVFGELYSSIKVSELISLGWLCDIIPYVFGTDTKSGNINEYNLEHFAKYNALFGFSFHNSRSNAFELFKKHYLSYKNNSTLIKPFLLVGNDFKSTGIDEIELDYDYRSVDVFKIENNSIAYICDMYKMGFDFDKLDYLIFSDPKISWQEIIQCIGRGTRSDKRGNEGMNLLKKLKVMLPVFVDENNETKYDNIVNVLQYLVYDVDILPETINMNFVSGGGEKTKTNDEEYSGVHETSAVILDLVTRRQIKWKLKDFVILLQKHNIHTREDYNDFCVSQAHLNLPEHPGRIELEDFTWEQTYETSPYYSEDDCRKKIIEIIINDDDLELNDMDYPEQYLYEQDNKIPPIDYKGFYGTDPPF